MEYTASIMEVLPNDTIKDICKTLDVPALSSLISTSKKVRDICGEVYNSYYIKYRQLLLLIYFFSVDKSLEVSKYRYDLTKQLHYEDDTYEPEEVRGEDDESYIGGFGEYGGSGDIFRKLLNNYSYRYSSLDIQTTMKGGAYKTYRGIDNYTQEDGTNPVADQIHKRAFIVTCCSKYRFDSNKLILSLNSKFSLIVFRPLPNTYVVYLDPLESVYNLPDYLEELLESNSLDKYIKTLIDPTTGKEFVRIGNTYFPQEIQTNLAMVLSTKEFISLLVRFDAPSDRFQISMNNQASAKFQLFIPDTDFDIGIFGKRLRDLEGSHLEPENVWSFEYQDLLKDIIDIVIHIEITVRDGQVQSISLYNLDETAQGDAFLKGNFHVFNIITGDEIAEEDYYMIIDTSHSISFIGLKWNDMCDLLGLLFETVDTVKKYPPDSNVNIVEVDDKLTRVYDGPDFII